MRKQAPTSLVDSPTLRSNSSAFSIISIRSDGSLRLSKNAVDAPAMAPPMIRTSCEHSMEGKNWILWPINQDDSQGGMRIAECGVQILYSAIRHSAFRI